MLFVVLDAVRADHTSLCGYERPTSPNLEQLKARGASVSCDVHAPSSWTLPSHASLFTGVYQDVHDTGNGPGTEEVHWGTVNPLNEKLPTLAERFHQRGYQTAILSANPLVSGKMGLLRGFDASLVAKDFERLRGEPMAQALGWLFQERLDQDKPLFLFVNIIDAHEPWAAVPPGVEWVPERPAMLGVELNARFEHGELSPEEREALLAQRRDVYDWGVSLADHTLGVLLQGLAERGRLAEAFRVVVTSDHGEYLGDHGRLGHGTWQLFEPVVRVPLLYWSSAGPAALHRPRSLVEVHDLVLEGRLPSRPGPILAGHWIQQRDAPETPTDCWYASVAMWSGISKYTCFKGEIARYDLAADPEEGAPEAQPAGPEGARMLTFARAMDAAYAARAPGNAELSRMLRSLGYLQ